MYIRFNIIQNKLLMDGKVYFFIGINATKIFPANFIIFNSYYYIFFPRWFELAKVKIWVPLREFIFVLKSKKFDSYPFSISSSNSLSKSNTPPIINLSYLLTPILTRYDFIYLKHVSFEKTLYLCLYIFF